MNFENLPELKGESKNQPVIRTILTDKVTKKYYHNV